MCQGSATDMRNVSSASRRSREIRSLSKVQQRLHNSGLAKRTIALVGRNTVTDQRWHEYRHNSEKKESGHPEARVRTTATR